MIVLFSSFHSRSLVHSNLLTVILPCSIPFDISAVAWPTFESTIFRSPFNYFVRLYRHGSSLSFDFYPITVLFAPLSEHTLLLLLLMLPFFFSCFFFFYEKNSRIPRFPFFNQSSRIGVGSQGVFLFWLVDGTGILFYSFYLFSTL